MLPMLNLLVSAGVLLGFVDASGPVNSVPVLDRSLPGQALLEARVLRSIGGFLNVTLTVGVAELRFPTTKFKTRLYNGEFPAPTLVVEAGDILTVTLVNELSDEDNLVHFNYLQEYNSTNLHTHGLHVSPNAPADDVFAEVGPGENRTYVYEIDAAHAGGHHWYHPHRHGSSAVQVGGGMFGSLIVQDAVGELPRAYAADAMETRVLNILSMPFKGSPSLTLIQNFANHALLQTDPDVSEHRDPNAPRSAGAVILKEGTMITTVNGAVLPRIALPLNTWRRFRIVHASTWWSMLTTIKGSEPGNEDPACEWKLLAKDGFYVSEAPRDFGLLPLTPACRVDIVLRCSRPGEFEWVGLDAYDELFGAGAANLAAVFGDTPATDTAQVDPQADLHRKRVYSTTIATFVVDADTADQATASSGTTEKNTRASSNDGAALVRFRPFRPCYAADLTLAPVDQSLTLNFTMKSVVDLDAPKVINGRFMPSDRAPLAEVDVGTVLEFHVHGANIHPFHIHINPLQLTGPGPGLAPFHETALGGFTAQGDWVDTVMSYSHTTKVRMITDVYTGPMTIHCHVLRHEDEGMMNTIAILGDEGATWLDAERYDPTCWRGNTSRGHETCFDGDQWAHLEHSCDWVSQDPEARCSARSRTGVVASDICQKSCGTCVRDAALASPATTGTPPSSAVFWAYVAIYSTFFIYAFFTAAAQVGFFSFRRARQPADDAAVVKGHARHTPVSQDECDGLAMTDVDGDLL